MATKKTTDQKIKELFDTVQEKKLAIEKAERPCWLTGGNFGYSANSAHDRTDVKTVTDVRKIVDMLAFLIDRKEKSEKAATELGVEYNFKWLGFTLDEWKNDFQTRVNQISILELRKKLSEMESRLNLVLTPALKAEMEVDSITDELSKMK